MLRVPYHLKTAALRSRIPLSQALVLGTLTNASDADVRYSGAELRLIRAARAVGEGLFANRRNLPHVFPVLSRRVILSKEDGCGCFAEPVTVLRMVPHLDLIHGWSANNLAAFIRIYEVNHD